MNRPVLVASVLVVLGIAIGIGYWFGSHQHAPPASNAVAIATGKQVMYWYDPMQPEQHFDQPGLSPMGMQMVPKYAQSGSDRNVVRIDPATMQNLGMRSAPVGIGSLTRDLHVPGTIAWNQRLAVAISARTDATIARLYVRAPYTAVQAGQPLAAVLAPQWRAAANEYFALGDARSPEAAALRDAARARLRSLGMDDATVRGLRGGSGTIVLRAPVDGVVSELDAREGQQIGAGMPIMSLNGLDTVWVDAAIPQADSGGIHTGTPIDATLSALPGETFHGKVEALLPSVDPGTRTQRARIVLENTQHRLAPGMFADLRIHGAASAPHPLVPDEALIATGTDTRVIEVVGDGTFKPVRVRTGGSSGGMTEILAGLQGGERVVTSGQFLIDSEASLSGALDRLGGSSTGKPAPAPDAGSASTPDSMPGMALPSAAPQPDQPAPERHPVKPSKQDMSGMDMGKTPEPRP